jgi:hypothetical protein
MSQNERICKNCNWFKETGWCNKEPKAEFKMANDFCSHWTPKMLNEVYTCCNGRFSLEA